MYPTEDIALQLLLDATPKLAAGFEHLPAAVPQIDHEKAASILATVAEKLHDNYPYQHPLYAGQMLKPPHPLARAAYALAMTINPNNHARDGGRASSDLEIAAVQHLATMFGWGEQHLGHLTSGGTFANLEALWIAGQRAPGKRIVGSDQAHYTHARISAVLGLTFTPVVSDNTGRIDIAALESELAKGDVSTVVVTMGTTALGAIDPLDKILALRKKYPFRIHADAAYGGYFRLIAPHLDPAAHKAFSALSEVDSIVLDPHKHGLQPYGCGSILFRDPTVGRFYKHDSPYTYFSSDELHLGEISLECSRAGSSAVALWATQQLLPNIPEGEFAAGLLAGRNAALDLYQRLSLDPRFVTTHAPQLDIVVWAVKANTTEASSKLAQQIFDEAARRDLHLALVDLPASWFGFQGSQGPKITCLRSVLMKPEHQQWLNEIWIRLSQATDVALHC